MLWDDLDKGDEREGGARERGYVLMQHYKAILLQLKKKKERLWPVRPEMMERADKRAWPGLACPCIPGGLGSHHCGPA